jgi:hypothetical protein
MTNRLSVSMIAVGTATVLVIAFLFAIRTEGQAQTQGDLSRGRLPQRPARIDGHPNLSGIWQAANEANWDLEAHGPLPAPITQPGVHPLALLPAAPFLAMGAVASVPGSIGVVEGGTIPYQDWARAQQKDNKEHWLDRDPEVKCFLAGIPRSMYLPHPIEILQGGKRVEMVFQYSSSGRTINMEQVDPLPDDTYNGFALGRWDGDTLVSTVTGFQPGNWLDRSGNFTSDALKVTERFTPLGDQSAMLALWYEATIEDPKVFSRPWKISMPLYRRVEPRAQLIEFRCQEFVEELIYGHLRRQQLVKHWDGKTLAIDIARKVSTSEEDLYEKHYLPPAWRQK